MWTDERVELLKKLWADGLSASQVAKQLGGVTRNAVIGKVHRLGLSGRVTPNRPARVRPATQERAPSRPRMTNEAATVRTAPAKEAPAHMQAAAEAKAVEAFEPERRELATVLTLTERTCKWPIGDPGSPEFHFCGKRRDSGSPYCTDHAKIAYQPVQPRRNRDRDRERERNRRDSGFSL
ncbi:MAG: GcrA family cell cycle regulator [Parvibaculaceae bacterium]|nr:GcrA family cell cycle regulator [Parvibaculaceae bacterium]